MCASIGGKVGGCALRERMWLFGRSFRGCVCMRVCMPGSLGSSDFQIYDPYYVVSKIPFWFK